MDKNKGLTSLPKLPMDAKLLLVPLGSLLLLVVLFLVLFKVGFARLNVQKAEIAQINKNIQILKNRQEILSKIEVKLQENSKFFATIFPEENPTLIIFSQLKNNALLLGLAPSNFKAGGESIEGDMKKSTISFELLGDMSGVFMFARNLKNLAPIIVLDRIKIGEVEGGIGASLSVKTYWAKTLNKLPAITDPIKDLTADEEETILKITSLTQPSFIEVTPMGASGRTEPF